MKGTQCTTFLQWALPRMGFRWPGFRRVRRQVCRRIDGRRQALGLADIAAYRKFLETNPVEFAVLDEFCRITISRFYRDRAVFDLLSEIILPALVDSAGVDHGPVRCWSAGCGAGEEPYSVGLAWRLGAARGRGRLHVVATDADPAMVERAARACYRASSLKELPEGWRECAFRRVGPQYRLCETYRAGIAFSVQDIRREMPPGPFDLVLCRNLAFTYFDEASQRRIAGDLVSRLRPGGVLVLGRREKLPPPDPGLIDLAPDLGVFRRPWARSGRRPAEGTRSHDLDPVFSRLR